MFKQSKGDDDDDENKMFKPVRPKRERLTEDAADEKESSNTGGEDAMGETKGRRRRDEDDSKKEEDAPLGWMTSPNKRVTHKLKIEEDEADVPSTANKNNKHFDDNQFDDGIMLIPELDEDGGGDEEGDVRVAQAPRVVHRKIPTLAELEKDARATVPVHEGQYDLGVLLRTLVPADQVMEDNDAWDFEQLLREVTDELTQTPKTVVSATISQSALNASKKSEGSKKKGSSGKNSRK